MQISSNWRESVRAMPIALNPDFPVHAPYLDRLHYSKAHPADYLHYHLSWEIGICFQGSGIFYIGNHVHHYAAGDVSVIAPGVVHIAQSDAERISGWKFLDFDLAKMLAVVSFEHAPLADNTFSGIVHSYEMPALAPLVLQILDELRFSRPFGRELIGFKIAEMAVLLSRLTGPVAVVPVLADSLSEISPAVLHIVNHYHEDITLPQLAAMCLKSVSSFRRAFERSMSTSPFEYLYNVRIKAAVNLLHMSSLPVAEIANRVGYRTLSSFNRHFKRITGMPPIAYRKMKRLS